VQAALANAVIPCDSEIAGGFLFGDGVGVKEERG